MSKYTRRVTASFAVVALCGVAACSRDKGAADSAALKTDSALNRDLSLAGRDTGVQPQLKDVPTGANAAAKNPAPTRTTTTPRTTTPRTTPTNPPARPTPGGNTVTTSSGGTVSGGGGGAVGTVSAGSTLNLRSNSRICTNTN